MSPESFAPAIEPSLYREVIVNPVLQVIPQSEESAMGFLALPRPHATYGQSLHDSGLREHLCESDEVDVAKFIDSWTFFSNKSDDSAAKRDATVVSQRLSQLKASRPLHIRASDVRGDDYDLQGINWTSLGTSVPQARKARKVYCEAVHGDRPGALAYSGYHGEQSLRHDNLVKFRRMNTEHRAWIEHFQLRNLLSVTSHNDIFYASRSKVYRTDAIGGVKATVMDFSDPVSNPFGAANFRITSMAAAEDIAIVGSYCGEYAMTALNSPPGTRPSAGLVSPDPFGIICHIELFARRGLGRPASAAFSSNDQHLRVLDCASNAFVSDFVYSHPINCSAADPGAQMRLVVGDSPTALVTAADAGDVLAELAHHSANVFAASWCADGVHVATGAEDGRVLVYDARRWSAPLVEIPCESACPRSLRFSPAGSEGPAMLLVAEAEDAVAVVEVEGGMFRRRQVVELFGSVAGTGWRPDGKSFWVANGDANFGGLMEFERAEGETASWGNARLGLEDFYARTRQRWREVAEDTDYGHMRHDTVQEWQIDDDQDELTSGHMTYENAAYAQRNKRSRIRNRRNALNLDSLIL